MVCEGDGEAVGLPRLPHSRPTIAPSAAPPLFFFKPILFLTAPLRRRDTSWRRSSEAYGRMFSVPSRENEDSEGRVGQVGQLVI